MALRSGDLRLSVRKRRGVPLVAGAATVELPETGEPIELQVGDIAYFSAGTQSVWTITKPVKKFVVMSS